MTETGSRDEVQYQSTDRAFGTVTLESFSGLLQLISSFQAMSYGLRNARPRESSQEGNMWLWMPPEDRSPAPTRALVARNHDRNGN